MLSSLHLARVGVSSLAPRRAFHTTRIAREHFLDANAESFKKRVLDEAAAKPILVDFYAAWCQPCRVLTPLLKGVTGPDSGYDLMTLDVDEYPELAAEYKVSALPTVVAFKHGKVANKFGQFIKAIRKGARLISQLDSGQKQRSRSSSVFSDSISLSSGPPYMQAMERREASHRATARYATPNVLEQSEHAREQVKRW